MLLVELASSQSADESGGNDDRDDDEDEGNNADSLDVTDDGTITLKNCPKSRQKIKTRKAKATKKMKTEPSPQKAAENRL